ncbi:MAG: hypothetical protein BMS9Abin30_0203 [Gammaproteobacteria bacterium]|nr:MAG: hypothetical protein BMS9Abin30_0203 [Gammaproteobacteria bacterium]
MGRALLLVIFMLLSSNASADSFRCGRSIVKVGDSSNSLISKCGDPIRKYTSKEIINNKGRQFRAGVSNWIYARKRGKDMVLAVYSGVVVKMWVD